MILINNTNVSQEEIFALLQTKFNISRCENEFAVTCLDLTLPEVATSDVAASDMAPPDVAAYDEPIVVAFDVPANDVVAVEPVIAPFTVEPEVSTLVAQPIVPAECPYVCDVSILTLGLSSTVPVYTDTSSSKSYLYVNELTEFGDSASFILNNNSYFRVALVHNDEGCTLRIVICRSDEVGSRDRKQYDLTVNLRKADGEPRLCLGNDNFVFASYLCYTDDKVSKE